MTVSRRNTTAQFVEMFSSLCLLLSDATEVNFQVVIEFSENLSKRSLNSATKNVRRSTFNADDSHDICRGRVETNRTTKACKESAYLTDSELKTRQCRFARVPPCISCNFFPIHDCPLTRLAAGESRSVNLLCFFNLCRHTFTLTADTADTVVIVLSKQRLCVRG